MTNATNTLQPGAKLGSAAAALATLLALGCQPAALHAAKTPRAPTNAAAASAGPSDDASVALLREVEARHGTLQSVTGAFRQTRRDDAANQSVKMDARFALQKPNQFRADYTRAGDTAAAETVLISGRESYQYVRELKQTNRYTFREGANVRDLNYLILGFGARADDVLNVYTARAAKAPAGRRAVMLVPKDKADSGFESIKMTLDAATLLPVQFTMVQAGQMTTTLDLNPAQLRMGAAPPADLFNPRKLPKAEEVKLN